MLIIEIPGSGTLELKNLVLDYNGTLGLDGNLLNGVRERIQALSEHLEVHVVTADTFGNVRQQLEGMPIMLHILDNTGQTLQKRRYIEKMGADCVIAIGNGSNDAGMLEAAALGICVLGPEGCSVKPMTAAKILVRDILDGLDLLLEPMRIKATLRE